jgi:hypothetical protein
VGDNGQAVTTDDRPVEVKRILIGGIDALTPAENICGFSE